MHWTFVAAAVLALSTIPTVSATHRGFDELSGTIAKLDSHSKILTVDSARGSIPIRFDDQTSLEFQDRAIRITDLKAGDRILITTTSNGLAIRIQLVPTMSRASLAPLPSAAGLAPLIGVAGILLIGISLSMRAARRFSI